MCSVIKANKEIDLLHSKTLCETRGMRMGWVQVPFLDILFNKPTLLLNKTSNEERPRAWQAQISRSFL